MAKHRLAQIKKDWKALGLDWSYWIRGENDERAVLEGCRPDPKAGKHICDFIENYCKLFKDRWAGQNVKLMDWQRNDWFMPIYAWKRYDINDNPVRRFRKASGWVPKKNAKSASASFSAVYGLIGEGDIGAEVYCLDASTRILYEDMTWRTIGNARPGDAVVGFDEEPQKGKYRKLRPSVVENVERKTLPCYEIRFVDGRKIIASSGHTWLGCATSSGAGASKWVKTSELRQGSIIREIGPTWETEDTRRAGYLAGVFDGEACFHKGKERSGFRIAFAQKPGAVLELTKGMLASCGFRLSSEREHGNGVRYIAICGLADCLRFLGQIRPARLLQKATGWWEGTSPNRGGCAVVEDTKYLGFREVVSIETSTRTFFAEGLFSHNCAACDRAQASIVFNESANIVEASPALSAMLTVTRSTKTINYGTNAWLKALSSEVNTKEGLNASTVIVDELHAHKNRDLFTTLMYSGRARQNFLMLIISTAGDDRESIGYEEYEYAKGVNDGTVVDTRVYSYIREAEPEDDWKSPKVWQKANPSYGIIISDDQMRQDCREAEQSPRKQADFKRYLLNIWVDSANPWLDMHQWDQCGSPFDDEALDGNQCYGGLDLSSTSDLSAFVLDFPGDDNTHRLKAMFWLPDEGPWSDDARYASSYREWIDKGFIKTTPGNRIDYDYIRQFIVECSEKYDLRGVAFDPWSATQLATALQDDHGVTMIEMRQGLKTMSEPCKSFEADVANKRIRHNKNPVMRWMAAHAVVKSDESDNVRIDKKNSRGRIDGIVAAVMATAIARAEVGESAELGVMLI